MIAESLIVVAAGALWMGCRARQRRRRAADFERMLTTLRALLEPHAGRKA